MSCLSLVKYPYALIWPKITFFKKMLETAYKTSSFPTSLDVPFV